ncbi:MAG: tetratricopeptide repeat protein [Clostridiales bacterium]|jgi:tetratricopeptide (TPR) repeat protein|nr:tetratricopeptide repeat protein [Clostridiales bacterium]
MKRVASKLTILALALTIFAACAAPARELTAAELLDLGEKYLLELDYEQAIVQFTRLIEIEPKNPRGYTGLAEAYVGIGDTDRAVEALRRGRAQLPDSAEIAAMLDELLPAPELTPEPTSELTPVSVDIVLTSEQFGVLEPIETAVLAADYAVAYELANSREFRSLCAEVSSGTDIIYKSDNSGIWKLRYIPMENSPEWNLEEGFSSCSIGVKLEDGRTHWFDSFTTDGQLGSNFRIYDEFGETEQLITFDGTSTRRYDGEWINEQADQ